MSSKNSNKLNVPEAREAMNKFKMEAANDLDVPTHIKIAPVPFTKLLISYAIPHVVTFALLCINQVLRQ